MPTETRDVRDFRRISLRAHGSLTVVQGEHESLEVEADESVLPGLTAEVSGDELILNTKCGFKRPLFGTTSPVTYRVTVRELATLEISGSGHAECAGLRGDRLSLVISGSGDITMSVELSELHIGISGSGDCRMSGTAGTLGISISGSGDCDASALVTEACDVVVSGSGRAAVHADKSLNARISGSGGVRYAGQPAISVRVSGSGSVHPA